MSNFRSEIKILKKIKASDLRKQENNSTMVSSVDPAGSHLYNKKNLVFQRIKTHEKTKQSRIMIMHASSKERNDAKGIKSKTPFQDNSNEVESIKKPS